MTVVEPEISLDWNTDMWQTPDEIASLMAQLVLPTDQRILEPAAGTGQIIKFLPKHIDLWAVEINYARVREQIKVGGLMHQLDRTWDIQHYDFLGKACEPDFLKKYSDWVGFDLIITNPPFSKCMEFLQRSLALLNTNNPQARLIFLLPLDWNCSKARGAHWQQLNAHIHKEYRIMGRVAFLDGEGVPRSRRQCSDAVFDIRPGRVESAVSYLGN